MFLFVDLTWHFCSPLAYEQLQKEDCKYRYFLLKMCTVEKQHIFNY